MICCFMYVEKPLKLYDILIAALNTLFYNGLQHGRIRPWFTSSLIHSLKRIDFLSPVCNIVIGRFLFFPCLLGIKWSILLQKEVVYLDTNILYPCMYYIIPTCNMDVNCPGMYTER